MSRSRLARGAGPCAAAFAIFTVCAPVARAQELAPPPPLPPTIPGYPGAYPTAPQDPAFSPGAPGSQTPTSQTPTSGGDDTTEGQDSGLGLEWVWVNAEVGASYVDMESLHAGNFGLEQTRAAGPAFGVGAGVRLLFFTLGLRARDLALSGIGNLWMLDAEAAFHLRIWRIDPYFGVRGGYDFAGTVDPQSVRLASGSAPSDVSVHGFDIGPMVGIDVYLNKWLSLGGDLDARLLVLHRPPLPLPPGVSSASALPSQDQALYANSGSSVGLSSTLTAHAGVHF